VSKRGSQFTISPFPRKGVDILRLPSFPSLCFSLRSFLLERVEQLGVLAVKQGAGLGLCAPSPAGLRPQRGGAAPLGSFAVAQAGGAS
jgi:hypothetical protein